MGHDGPELGAPEAHDGPKLGPPYAYDGPKLCAMMAQAMASMGHDGPKFGTPWAMMCPSFGPPWAIGTTLRHQRSIKQTLNGRGQSNDTRLRHNAQSSKQTTQYSIGLIQAMLQANPLDTTLRQQRSIKQTLNGRGQSNDTRLRHNAQSSKHTTQGSDTRLIQATLEANPSNARGSSKQRSRPIHTYTQGACRP
jgi:hypothetical protein